jgi:hypothetical protein
MAQTSTKATAGAIGGALGVVARWILMKIPGLMGAPPDVQGAFQILVLMGIPYLFVYYAPANKFTKPLLDIVDTPTA